MINQENKTHKDFGSEGRNDPSQGSGWQPGLVLFARLSSWVAGPIVISLLFGGWLDNKYGTKPWLTLAFVGLAFFISMLGIAKEGTKAMNAIEKQAEQEKKEKQTDGSRKEKEKGDASK